MFIFVLFAFPFKWPSMNQPCIHMCHSNNFNRKNVAHREFIHFYCVFL